MKQNNFHLILFFLIFLLQNNLYGEKNTPHNLNRFMDYYGITKRVRALDMSPHEFNNSDKKIKKELFFAYLQVKNDMNNFIKPVLKLCKKCESDNILKREKLNDFLKSLRLKTDIEVIKKMSDLKNMITGKIYYKNEADKNRVSKILLLRLKSQNKYKLIKVIEPEIFAKKTKNKKYIIYKKKLILLENNITGLTFTWVIVNKYCELVLEKKGITVPGKLLKIMNYKKIKNNIYNVDNYIFRVIWKKAVNNSSSDYLFKKIARKLKLVKYSKKVDSLVLSASYKGEKLQNLEKKIIKLQKKASILLKKIYSKAGGVKWFIKNIPAFSLNKNEIKELFR